MDKFLEEVVNSLDKLYWTYENYIWKNDNCKLDVLLQDKAISFYLYKDKEVIDEIIVSFDDKEENVYKYLCVRLLFVLFSNCCIYNKDNEFYNKNHKSYLNLVVNDMDVLYLFRDIVKMQEDMIVNENMSMVLEMRENLVKKRYYNQFISQFNTRIELSKKLLRRV